VNPERYARLKELVLTAARLDGTERAAYLEGECAGDPDLRAEAESLLSQGTDSDLIRTGGAQVPPGLAAALEDADLPERVGPYAVLGILGEGGMGVVYHARQTEPIRREVAVKVIRRGMDTDRVVARFESERQALALMDHPGIARVLDAGADDRGRPYFVMELVRGIPLIEYADERKLGTQARLELFLAVCQAVQHAHQKGVIHRDLKPSNVLVTEVDGRPQPKIIDFGIAKATLDPVSGHSLVTEAGQLVGTPEYMSPEQAGLSGAGVDTRTDVYSLGVLLYELLTGRRPYRIARHVLAEIQRVIGEGEPERPSTAVARKPEPGEGGEVETRTIEEARGTTVLRLRRQLAGDLDTIILMSLRKEPERRYGSVEQFAEDLRRHLEGLPVRARPDTWTYRTGKFVRRNRAGVAAAAAVLVLVVGFAAAMTVQSARVAHQRDRAVAAEARARTEAETARRVSDFMTGLFQVADPFVSQSDTVTARQVLDRGADRIRDELADEPRVQASLMSTMSRAYGGLRAGDRSLELAREGLAIRRGLPGDQRLDVTESLADVAAALSVQGAHAEAESLYREVLDRRRELQGPDHLDIAEAASLLALNLHTQGRFAEAESLYRESLDMTRRLVPEDDSRVTWGINNLAGILMAESKGKEAEALLREALGRAEAAGTDSILTADIASTLAVLLKSDGRMDEAEPYYRQALEIRQHIFGDHPITAQSYNNLGAFLKAQGKYAQAEPYLRKALEIHLAYRGENHMDVAIAEANLASNRHNQGKDAEAETLYRKSLSALDHTMGKDYWLYSQVEVGYGTLLLDQHRTREAEPLLVHAAAGLAKGLGRQHRRTVAAVKKVVELYEAEGRKADAAKYRALLSEDD